MYYNTLRQNTPYQMTYSNCEPWKKQHPMKQNIKFPLLFPPPSFTVRFISFPFPSLIRQTSLLLKPLQCYKSHQMTEKGYSLTLHFEKTKLCLFIEQQKSTAICTSKMLLGPVNAGQGIYHIRQVNHYAYFIGPWTGFFASCWVVIDETANKIHLSDELQTGINSHRHGHYWL